MNEFDRQFGTASGPLHGTPALGRCERLFRAAKKVFPQLGISLFVCSLALLPLFNLKRNFDRDWFDHLWQIEYTGQHIASGRGTPDTLDTPQLIGCPNPLFYASKFYALLGFASIWLGSGIAFRLFTFFLLLLQFWHVQRASGLFCSHPCVNLVPAVAISWATYPLVNLYERNDLTEFTAITFLVSAVAALFVLLVRNAHGRRDIYGCFATGLLYGFAALTHPLTGLYGGLLLSALALVGLITLRSRRILHFSLINVLLLSCLLSPWLYVVIKFGHAVEIADLSISTGLFEGSYISSSFAALASTLHPVSTGPAFFWLKSEMTLRIPMCVALLFCTLSFAVIWRKVPRRAQPDGKLLLALLSLSTGCFGLCLFVYCLPCASAVLGGAFDVMQYRYRLISYVDVSLLVSVFCLLGLIDWQRLEKWVHFHRIVNALTLGAYMLAASALAGRLCFVQSAAYTSKLDRIIAGQFGEERSHWYPGIFGVDKHFVAQLPATWYSGRDYEIDTGYSDLIRERSDSDARRSLFTLDSVNRAVLPVEIDYSEPTEQTTNVSPFPWNVIKLDGQPIAHRTMAISVSASRVTGNLRAVLRIRVPTGLHVLSYAFVPDKPWPLLKGLSWTVLLIWTASWLGMAVCRATHRVRKVWTPMPISLATLVEAP